MEDNKKNKIKTWFICGIVIVAIVSMIVITLLESTYNPIGVIGTDNYSIYKVTASVSEVTNTGISFTIKDINEEPRKYANTYTLNKKNKQADNIPIDTNRIIPGTENSTSAYLRSCRSDSSMGRNFKDFRN